MSVLKKEIEEYLTSLYVPMTEELGALRLTAEKDNIPIILRDTEKFLVNMIKTLNVKHILEIGTAVGYSSSCFACISKDIHVTTIEKSEKMFQTANSNIQNLGYEKQIHVIKEDALVWLEAEKRKSGKGDYDMIFIDGPKSQYMKLWKLAGELISSKGIIVVDNVLFRGFVAYADDASKKRYNTIIKRLQEFTKFLSEDHNSVILPIGDGISVSYINNI